MNSRNFKLHEFACKCKKCGLDNIDLGLVSKLDDARDMAGIPFTINSGLRCASWNRAVGGSPTSSHMKGLAVDIAADNSAARFLIVDSLIRVGLTRIGIAKTFIHCDVDPNKTAKRIWLY
jgi:uncharacterized protein YcbK (DUF882 family)